MQLSKIDPTPSLTFVIGAGASKEVNMPTGHELKKTIATSLGFEVDTFHKLTGGNDRLREALYLLGQQQPPKGNINDYLQTARLISSAMPQAPSIDNFIDSHRENSRIAELGKLSIASSILDAERCSQLYVDPRNKNNKINFDVVADTWFNLFFQMLTLNTQAKDLPTRLQKVCIISFNYDRTLEHFLHCSLQNYYDLSSERAAECLSELRVLHPYGSVGPLPWQHEPNAIPFGAELSTQKLFSLMDALRTFTEGTDTSTSQIELIRSFIREAERLVFLGFAYLELNLQVLFSQQAITNFQSAKHVYGTAFGLSESNKREITYDLNRLGGYDPSRITLRRELTAAQLLHEYSRTLRI